MVGQGENAAKNPKTSKGTGSRKLMATYSADKIPGGNNAGSHIIDSELRDSTIQYSDRKVGAPVAKAAVKEGVTWHRHIKSSQCTANTGMLSQPITHDKALKAKLAFQ